MFKWFWNIFSLGAPGYTPAKNSQEYPQDTVQVTTVQM